MIYDMNSPGIVIPGSGGPPYYQTDADGNILYDDNGDALLLPGVTRPVIVYPAYPENWQDMQNPDFWNYITPLTGFTMSAAFADPSVMFQILWNQVSVGTYGLNRNVVGIYDHLLTGMSQQYQDAVEAYRLQMFNAENARISAEQSALAKENMLAIVAFATMGIGSAFVGAGAAATETGAVAATDTGVAAATETGAVAATETVAAPTLDAAIAAEPIAEASPLVETAPTLESAIASEPIAEASPLVESAATPTLESAVESTALPEATTPVAETAATSSLPASVTSTLESSGVKAALAAAAKTVLQTPPKQPMRSAAGATPLTTAPDASKSNLVPIAIGALLLAKIFLLG